MKLTQVRVARFKNVVDEQIIEIEEDITCLIGKNEAGKTTILKALHRLNPANNADTEYLTVEYPRWRLWRQEEGDPRRVLSSLSLVFC
jgi:predicted ATP-dependent endonuclease of OLD family